MNLRRKQQLCIDAITHSFMMAESSYQRIVQYCRLPNGSTNEVLDSQMVLDAWSFIDVTKRFWSIIHNTPGLIKGNTYNSFVRSTSDIVDFRNYIQHVEDETHDLSLSGKPIWGSFSWGIFKPDKTFEIKFYYPGTIAIVKGLPIMNPAGRLIHSDIDHFEITVDSKTINISEYSRKLMAFQPIFQDAVSNASKRGSGDNEILLIDLDGNSNAA